VALETATYISDLVATNPTASDPKNQGDDHLRLVKSTLQTTFPNVTGAVTPTHTVLNYMLGVTSSVQTQLDAKFAASGTLGADHGGTGVANNVACTTTRVGNFALTQTLTGITSVTFPVTGTLATIAGAEAFTNKTISGASNTISNIAGSALTGAYTAAGMTLNTAKLLGRTTAASGAAEEIAIGTGLAMSAGTLTATAIPLYGAVSGSNFTTSSLTLVNVTGLTVALAANSTYLVQANISHGSDTSAGIALAVQYSVSGATIEAGLIAYNTAGGLVSRRISAFNTTTSTPGLSADSTDHVAQIGGLVITGANAGNLTIQMQKNTSGTATCYIGSVLTAIKVA
jgi:hypothetical protein